MTGFTGFIRKFAEMANESQESAFSPPFEEAYNGHRRLYNEPWEDPSKPMQSGFAEALQRAFAMG